MSDFFGKLMTRIVALAGFPLIVYESETRKMFRFNANGVENIPVPPIIVSDIENEETFFANKTSGNKNIIVYFFRWIFGGKKYVIVINDVSNRAKLGRFVNVLATVLKEMHVNRNALLERIKILKNSLDNTIKDREKYVSEMQVCQNRLDRAIVVRNDAVDRLNIIMAENSSLQNSISESETKKQELEIALEKSNETIEQIRIESEGKDFAVKNLEKSVEEIRKTTAAEYDSKIKQLLKVRNEAVIRLKAQMEVNSTLETTVATVQDAVRRLELSVKEKEERIALMRAEFDHQTQNQQNIKDYEAKLAKVIEVRNEAVNRLKALTQENQSLKSVSGGASIAEFQKTVKEKDEEIEQLSKAVSEKNEILKEKDAKIAKTRFYLEEMTELVKVVKRSRDKIMTLTDFITVPMYSVSGERLLVHANNALAAYVKAPSVAKIVGKSCHKLIFNLDEPCPWCQLEKVQKSGSSTTVGVIVNDAGKRRNIELTIFPILDSTGTLIDCGEFIVDKTDTFELAQSLQKFKEQVMSFKRAKISGMNEIQDVKNAYDELSNNYDLVVARNNKLSQALESLLVQDNNKEVISAKNEAAEYKATAHRYSGMINNYKKNLEELQAKYVTLNRQTFSQIERLINVVKAKPNTDLKEIGDMLSSIGIDFNEASKIINRR